jgi:ketosteroid isomerase-like protein
MAQEYVDAVRRSIDGWNRDDFDTCVSIAHPEIEWVSDLAIRMHGPEAVRLDVTEMIDAGDTVIVLAQTRALGDASGVEFEQLIAYVYEFEDGMARRVRSYHDPDRAFEAVGLPR